MPPWCRTTWRARFLLAPSSMIPSCFQKTTHGAKCWEVPAPTRRVSPYTYHITGNRCLVPSTKRLWLPEPHSKMFNVVCGMRAPPRISVSGSFRRMRHDDSKEALRFWGMMMMLIEKVWKQHTGIKEAWSLQHRSVIYALLDTIDTRTSTGSLLLYLIYCLLLKPFFVCFARDRHCGRLDAPRSTTDCRVRA